VNDLFLIEKGHGIDGLKLELIPFC